MNHKENYKEDSYKAYKQSNSLTLISNIKQLYEKKKESISKCLPATSKINSEYAIASLIAAINKNEFLWNCTPISIFECFFSACQLGLSLNPYLEMAYLVPRKDKCTLLVGYKGLCELMYRSGKISTIFAMDVCEHDVFEFDYGTCDSKFSHKPNLTDRGAFIGAYVYIKMTSGDSVFYYMNKKEIDARKARSTNTRKFNPWDSDYNEMAKKTVLRMCRKMLPLNIDAEMTESIEVDEESSDYIDGDLISSSVIEEKRLTQADKLADLM